MNTKEDSYLSLHQIIRMFEKHKSIINIIKKLKHKGLFEFQPTTNKLSLNLTKKAHGHGMISAKFLKLSVNIIAGPLANILNKSILQRKFPSFMEMAVFSPYTKRKIHSTKRIIDQLVF